MISFLWAAFIPTYLMSQSTLQVPLMALAVCLSVALTNLCIFMPKIYALYFVDADALVLAARTSASVVGDFHAATTD